MGDREVNEGPVDESICPMKGEESTVEETEMYNITTADTSDITYIDIYGSKPQQETDLNWLNKEGYTKIGCAVNQRDKKCVESMLKHPSANRLHLDYYPGDSEYTVREIIIETYPDLQPLLPTPLMESLDSSERNIKLLAALQGDNYDIFEENLDSENLNPWYGDPYHSSLLEIACQIKNREQFAKLLLAKGADPNIKNRITGMPLLHATARSGNLELLEMLLEEKRTQVTLKDNKKRTILHSWAWVTEKNPKDKERLERCFERLLQKRFVKNGHIEDHDISGNTPFSFAVEREHIDRIILILNTCTDDAESDHMNHILQSASKSLLKTILDYCFDSNDVLADSKDLKVTLKFYAVTNMTNFLVESHHKDLLKHPVMSTFLKLVWEKIKLIFFINVALYVIFLLLLTAYILFSEFCNMQNNRGFGNNTDGLLSQNNGNVTCGMMDETRYNISQSVWYALMILLGFICLREVGQILLYHKDYIMAKENWLKFLLIFVTFISCSGIVDSIEVNRHLFAIAILLGWFELVLLLGRLPLLSVQTEMLKKVSLTFLKFMAGYMVLILAFAFSFYILFEENAQAENATLFTNPLISILKTIIMSAGEFEASNLPFDTVPVTSHVIFMLFVVFVSIVLLNLMNGLAVGDTKKVREAAKTLSLEARVRLIKHISSLYFRLPIFMTGNLIQDEKTYVIFPNKKKNIGSSKLRHLQRIITEKSERIKKGKTIEHVENWKLFAEKLSTLQLQSEEMRQMLNKILTHLNIPEP